MATRGGMPLWLRKLYHMNKRRFVELSHLLGGFLVGLYQRRIVPAFDYIDS